MHSLIGRDFCLVLPWGRCSRLPSVFQPEPLKAAIPATSCPRFQFHLPTFLTSCPWGLLTKPFLIAKLVFPSTHRKIPVSKSQYIFKIPVHFHFLILQKNLFPFLSQVIQTRKISCKKCSPETAWSNLRVRKLGQNVGDKMHQNGIL